ncbi:MAG: prenyltransferase [Thermodesulfobacteriota bacterium]
MSSFSESLPRPTLRTWFLETRPHFLLLTPACVLVGVAAAYWDLGRLEPLALFLSFIGALLGHISVNVLNDVEDFLVGIDQRTVPTPFSGGSGFLVRGELSPQAVRHLGLGAFALMIPIGAFFLWKVGWGILPLGIAGGALVLFYTRHITHHPIICLAAPGLGFGPVMVLGVAYCQSGSYGSTALAASVLPAFLVSDLLLLNQFPDVEADAFGGRSHIPLKWGLRKASILYGVLLIAPFLWVAAAVGLGLLPWGALLCWLTIPLALKAASGVPGNFQDRDRLIPLMGTNVMVTLLAPTLMALGMILQRLL